MAKKLTRSTTDKILGGVCGGVARYLGVDAGLTRLITAAIVLLTGIGPVAYIGAWFLLPDDNGSSGLDWAMQQMRRSSTNSAPPAGQPPHNADDLR